MLETVKESWEIFNQTPASPYILTVISFIGFVVVWKLTHILVDRRYKNRLLKVNEEKEKIFKGLTLGSYELVNPHIQRMVLIHFYKFLRLLALFAVIIAYATVLFYANPLTKEWVLIVVHKLITPLKEIGMSIIAYLPKLIIIIMIGWLTRTLIRIVSYFSVELEEKRLVIKGMYPEWAQPTAAALKILLFIIGVVLIAPYLPGSSSGAFKGISIMVGVLVSIGSSSSVGNAIAGLILTYMRSFKVGDRVRIDGTEGVVVEKNLLVTRIKTYKNERVTIPNGEILSNPIVNLTYSAHNYNLTIFTSVTIGYDEDWRKVHQLLISAATAVEEVLDDPAPFVLQVSLNDFYVEYQLNARVNKTANIPHIRSEIHQNIQDEFKGAAIEILSPHYRMRRNDTTENGGWRVESGSVEGHHE